MANCFKTNDRCVDNIVDKAVNSVNNSVDNSGFYQYIPIINIINKN